MNRSEEMEAYLQDYRIQRTMLKREKLDKWCNYYTESYEKQVELLIKKQIFRQQEKRQGAVKYIMFCNLLSSGYTNSYEIALGLADERLYLDEKLDWVYWRPEYIYTELDQDMKDMARLLRGNFVRIEQYELLYLQRKLLIDDWELFVEYLSKVSDVLLERIIESPLLLEQELEILHGGYMDEPNVAYKIVIKEREGPKWEKVHFT